MDSPSTPFTFKVKCSDEGFGYALKDLSVSTVEEATLPLAPQSSEMYWDPIVETMTDGTCRLQFYTSDVKGKYIVSVEGVSDTGVPGSAQCLITVD